MKRFLSKRVIGSALIMLSTSIFIKRLSYEGYFYLSDYLSFLLDLLTIIASSLLIRISLELIFIFVSKKMFKFLLLYKRFFHLLLNVLVLTFFLSGIFFLFQGSWILIKDPKIFISMLLIIGIVWSLFFTRAEIRNYTDFYLKKFDIDMNEKTYSTLKMYCKTLAGIVITKLSLEIVSTLQYVQTSELFKLYSKQTFKLVDFLLMFYTILIFKKVMNISLDKLSHKIKESDNESLQNYLFLIPLFGNLGTIIIFILFFLVFLRLFDYTAIRFVSSIPAILQSIGILGVGLSFIAKDTISNFLSGIFIITDAPFVIGDRISIGEIYGDVIDIGIRTTRVRTLHNTIITVPNSKFTEDAVTSFRRNGNKFVVRNSIFFMHGMDVIKVKEVLLEALNNSEEVLKVPLPKVYIAQYGKDAVEYRMIFWIRDISRELLTLDSVNVKIIEIFDRENFKFCYPSINLNMSGGTNV